MGAKCSSLCSGPDKVSLQFRDSLPSDVDQYHPDRLKQKLPKLSFQGNISDIKIINCPQNSYFSIKIQISDIIEIDLPKRKVQPITEIKRESGQQIVFVQNQLKWLSREKLAFMMDEYQLRTHFLNVYIYNQQNQVASNIRVNLYTIITGPYRYDFYVNLDNHASRLIFEIYVSEKVEAKLQPLQVKIQLQKSYFAQEFNFSLKQLTHGQVVSTSKVSPSQKTLPQTSTQWSFDRQYRLDGSAKTDSPMLKTTKGRYLSIPGDPRKTLKWVSHVDTSNHNKENIQEINLKIKHPTSSQKKKLPHLKVFILSNQIPKSSIHFNVWINKQKNLSDLPLKHIEKDSIIFGSVYINLKKIFDQEFTETDARKMIPQADIRDSIPNYKLETRQFSSQDNLISKEGLVIGRCWLKFRLTNPKFFKQLSYCAKTQDGIINMTSAFKNYSGKSVYLRNPIVKDIINHSLKIHNLTKKLSIMQATIGNDRKDILRTENQVHDQFQIINRELVNSNDSSYILSSSNLQIQLLQTQDAFIQILEQLYLFLAQKSWRFKDICWEISLNIFKRGQFFLENLGFKDVQKKQFIEAQSIGHKKVAIGLRFKCILYKFLIIALQEYDKQTPVNKTAWKQLFKAFGCFRIPLYKDIVIGQIYKEDQQSLLDSKFPGFDQVYVPISSKFSSDFEKSENHLDWKRYFYDPLDSKEESNKLDTKLVKVLQTNKWVRVLKQKSTQFYLFVGYASKLMGEIAKNLKIIKWRYFPGYTKIVHSFLIQMKKQQLLSYSTIMIQTSINLLFNTELINILVSLVLEKTDVNNHQSLSKGLNLFWSYLSQVTKDRKRMLPQIFNYMYFYKIIKLVFQSDNSFALGKILILIEYFFKSFNEEFKQNLAMYLMGKVFFKLFFHWSYAIRMVFHVIIVSKIHFHLIKRLDQSEVSEAIKTKESFMVIFIFIEIQAHHELQQRYSKIMKLIYSAEKLKKQEENQQFYSYCFKQLHKKMQKKLIQKKSTSQVQDHQKKCHSSQIINLKSQYLIQNLMKIQYDVQGLEKDSFYFLHKTNKYPGKSKVLRVKSYDDQTGNQGAVVFHGQSFTCQDSNFQKCLRKFDTEIQKEQQQYPNSSEDRHSKNASLSFSSDRFNPIKKELNGSSKQKFKSMKFDLPQPKSARKKEKFTYFGTQDNTLQQITETQIREILVSVKQFRKIRQKIQKFVVSNGRTPEFDFNVQLGRDQEFDSDQFKWKT